MPTCHIRACEGSGLMDFFLQLHKRIVMNVFIRANQRLQMEEANDFFLNKLL